VTYAGNDDGGQVREVSHPTRRRVRINPTRATSCEYNTVPLRVGHRLVKWWPPGDERKKARRYRLRLDCRTKDCDGGIEVRRRSRAEAVRTARNVLRWQRRQREAAA